MAATSQTHLTGPIFWALDPFFADMPLITKCANLLSTLQNSQPSSTAKIQPVTVMAPDQINFPPEYHGKWESQFREGLSHRISNWIASGEHSLAQQNQRPLDPIILTQSQFSVRRSVEEFLKVARAQGASLVVAATQTHRNLEDLVLGSFCEALVEQSTLPILTINPLTRVPQSIQTLFFPTDLSEHSKKFLPKLAFWSRVFDAEVVLLHKVLIPAPSVIEPGFVISSSNVQTIHELFLTHEEQQTQTANKWQSELKSLGATCQYKMLKGRENLSRTLLQASDQRENSLLVATLHPGLDSARIFSRVSRDLVRKSQIPVLTLAV